MSVSTATATEDHPQRMGELGRITGVFWSPGAAFKDIAARPAPWVPIVIMMITGLILTYTFTQMVGVEAFLEQELANNSRVQELPLEQQQQIIEQQGGVVGVMMYLGPTVFMVIILALVAGALLLLMKIGGGSEVTYGQSFGITAYAWMPYALLSLLALIVLFVNPSDFDLQNPLPFNIGWFLDPASSPAWMISLLKSIDLFAFWAMALMAFGFSAAARKLSFGKAFGLVLTAWLVVVVVKTGWAAAFG
jgi:Yip1-like protein